MSKLRLAAMPVLFLATTAHAQVVPAGFHVEAVASGFDNPVRIALTGDGRLFVAEQRGTVYVVDGDGPPTLFIDLSDEVNGQWDRGMLGLALDPDFLNNRHVYLLYTVDPVFGPPDESPFDGTFSRLTRYTGTVGSNGSVADLGSRQVLIGATHAEGIPVCEPSHTIGSVQFGLDGTLLVSAGDGAHFNAADPGGLDPDCFGPGLFGRDEDIGAFRSQYLDSLAGKILRIDPATGLGLPSNPHWTGNGADNRSRVWANGLRNPFRCSVKPGSGGSGPGTLYIGDVGWNLFEEINVCKGNENFGWPCIEGPDAAPNYPGLTPAHSGCDTLETPNNPGTVTGPLVTWHHFSSPQSIPPGFTGRAAIGGVFYTGNCYPRQYQGAYFFADYSSNWIRVIQVDAQDNFVGLLSFATNTLGVVDMITDPQTGDLLFIARITDDVRRITFDNATVGDLDGDCIVGIQDFLGLLAAWGSCPSPPTECPADLDGDGSVGILDFLLLLANWS